MTGQERDVEALAEWLGALPESYNIFGYDDEATTWIKVPVESLAEDLLASDWLAERDARIKAEAWDEGEQAGRDNADDGYPDPMVENPYRADRIGGDQ